MKSFISTTQRFAKLINRCVIPVLLGGSLGFSNVAFAQTSTADQPVNKTRQFMLSATYGALAGALVGGASLAFADRPGDNLNKVARGASLGLYAGILLGLYVVYGGSSSSSDDYDDDASMQMRTPKFIVGPVITERGLEGAEGRFSVLEF